MALCCLYESSTLIHPDYMSLQTFPYFYYSLFQPSEKSPEDSLQFPWKHKEILVFEIPVHDSERAGLGKIYC